MSNQPEQPQYQPGMPQDYTPPGYTPAPAAPPVFDAPPADFQGQNQQFNNPQAPFQPPYGQVNQDPYGQPFAQPYGLPPLDQHGQPIQNPYGAPIPGQFGAPQFAAPTYYQGGPGYIDATSGPRGMSLASMIIGLSSLFIAGWLIVPQIIGIVLGHIGLSKESPQGKPFSITGLITNYLALLVYGGLYLFLIFIWSVMGTESYSPSSEPYTWLGSGL